MFLCQRLAQYRDRSSGWWLSRKGPLNHYFVSEKLIRWLLVYRINFIPDEDINECDQFEKNKNSPCDLLADCVNKPGNFTCQCRDGYQGEVNVGFSVTDRSRCLQLCRKDKITSHSDAAVISPEQCKLSRLIQCYAAEYINKLRKWVLLYRCEWMLPAGHLCRLRCGMHK